MIPPKTTASRAKRGSFSISPFMVSRWKKEFVERASEVFKKGSSEAEKELEKEQRHVAELERKVGQLTYKVDWLKNSY